MVAQCCKAVIACRARKDQKAKLTRLVRKGNREVVTLGVGDGANDVEMIRAAHIGVGIIGKEGTQAVNNADYAISQFRYLTRLILVYGHREYRGITLAALLIVVLAPPELVQEFAAEGTPMLLALLALGNLSFWLCDRALTAITPLYRQRIAPRLKKKF